MKLVFGLLLFILTPTQAKLTDLESLLNRAEKAAHGSLQCTKPSSPDLPSENQNEIWHWLNEIILQDPFNPMYPDKEQWVRDMELDMWERGGSKRLLFHYRNQKGCLLSLSGEYQLTTDSNGNRKVSIKSLSSIKIGKPSQSGECNPCLTLNSVKKFQILADHSSPESYTQTHLPSPVMNSLNLIKTNHSDSCQ
jgi:hypothetical protein